MKKQIQLVVITIILAIVALPLLSYGASRAEIDRDANSALRQLYDGKYFKGEEYLDYQADEAFFRRNFRKRLAQVRKHRSTGRLLEIIRRLPHAGGVTPETLEALDHARHFGSWGRGCGAVRAACAAGYRDRLQCPRHRAVAY